MRRATKWAIIGGVVAMGVMSQNLFPIHIAFIPLLIPPILGIMNELKLDRRLVACAFTFGIVTAYMFLPIGFGRIYLHDILFANIEKAGMNLDGVNPTVAMAIPALSMLVGLILSLVVYSKPREYAPAASEYTRPVENIEPRKVWAAVAALLVCFAIQTWLTIINSDADPLLIGALGDAGSPASDSTLGPTTGLNVDGQHDHMRDTVIPTFLHYNIPLLIGGWIAAMVL